MPNWCTNRLIVIDERSPGNGRELEKFINAITIDGDTSGGWPSTVGDHEHDLTLPYPTPEILLGTRSPKQTVEQIEEMRAKRDAGEMKAHENYVGETQDGSWCTDEYLQEQLDQIKQGDEAHAETGFHSWYDWNIAHWSTKWSPDVHEILVDVGGDLSPATVSYQTAWGPSEALIAQLSKLHPALTFVESYIEEGMCFWGANVYIEGEQRHSHYGHEDEVMDSLQEKYGKVLDDDTDADEEDRMMIAITERWQGLMDRAETDALSIAAVLNA